MKSKKLLFCKLATFTILCTFSSLGFSYETERVEACGIAINNNSARSAAWTNANCPEGYIKDEDPDFLCGTLTESLERELQGQDCNYREGNVLVICTIRCFKDGFVDNVMRTIFPPNSPNDIGNGRRTHSQRCVNIRGVLSCR